MLSSPESISRVNERNRSVRILGVDYGARRIGLAVTDEAGLMAHGLATIEVGSDEEALAAIRGIIAEREIGEIVVGLPRNMDGSLGPQAERALQFVELLRSLGLPVHTVDERLTSERARRTLREAGVKRSKHRRTVDRVAAQFILQHYLDARGKTTAD
jgi:putative Holliday junction resolvase